MNCKYLSWKFSQLNCKNSLTRIFDLLSNCMQNLMHLFYDTWRRNFNIFERLTRSKPLTHQTNFDLKYIQDILLFHIAWLLYHYTQSLTS